MGKIASVAFLGTLVPDDKEFQNKALTPAGNLAQDGIVCGLSKLGFDMTVLSHRPIPSFPGDSTIFSSKRSLNYKNHIKLIVIPFLNILFLKTVTGAIYQFFGLIKWAYAHRKNQRFIVVYNPYTPPLPFVYWMGKLTGSKSVAILYDLGMPPRQLKLGRMKRMIYKFVEFFAKHFISRLDGRIVITENIARDYAPGKDFLLIDGGISDNIKDRLFDLVEKKNRNKTIFLCAGSLWGANGTELILEALKINRNPNIEMWFAGAGPDVDKIKLAAEKDKRIQYKGKLDLDQLFEVYKQVDVLMNLRINSEGEGDYLFPSKIIEYLTIGKYTISTRVVHIEKEYGDYCEILSRNNPIVLSELIDEIATLTEDELFKLGSKAREFMLQHHTWDQKSIRIKEYLNQIAS